MNKEQADRFLAGLEKIENVEELRFMVHTLVAKEEVVQAAVKKAFVQARTAASPEVLSALEDLWDSINKEVKSGIAMMQMLLLAKALEGMAGDATPPSGEETITDEDIARLLGG